MEQNGYSYARKQASREYLPALWKGRDACDALTPRTRSRAGHPGIPQGEEQMLNYIFTTWESDLCILEYIARFFWLGVSGEAAGILQEYVTAGTTEVAWAWRDSGEEHLRSQERSTSGLSFSEHSKPSPKI